MKVADFKKEFIKDPKPKVSKKAKAILDELEGNNVKPPSNKEMDIIFGKEKQDDV